jgi:hypothetical protein
MTQYQYDTDVPAPVWRNPGKGYTDAIRALQPGQSVLLPTKVHSARAIIYTLVGSREWRKGELVARTEGDGCRVWRLQSG